MVLLNTEVYEKISIYNLAMQEASDGKHEVRHYFAESRIINEPASFPQLACEKIFPDNSFWKYKCDCQRIYLAHSLFRNLIYF